MNITRTLAALAAAGSLAACTAGQGAVQPPVTSVGNVGSPNYSHLAFAAGTANIGGQIGVNIVTTLRQANGLSAVGSDAPAITWDGAFTNQGAVAKSIDFAKQQYTGTLPVTPAGSASAPKSTFSTSNGIFDIGILPANSSATSNTISHPCFPYQTANYAPVLAAPGLGGGDENCAVGAPIYGGPPAFPNIRGAALTGNIGAFLGLNAFMGETPAVNPATGKLTFTLNVSIPTAPVTTLSPLTATVANVAGLPTFTTPTFASDGTGGGSVSYVLPAGVTEAYIEVIDWGPDPLSGSTPSANCLYGGLPPYFYTIQVTSSGTSKLTDSLGASPPLGALPAGRSTHTICTAADNTAAAAAGIPITNGGTAVAAGSPSASDQVQVIGIGFDYPAYEFANAAGLLVAQPTLAGAAGQSDFTMSDVSAYINE